MEMIPRGTRRLSTLESLLMESSLTLSLHHRFTCRLALPFILLYAEVLNQCHSQSKFGNQAFCSIELPLTCATMDMYGSFLTSMAPITLLNLP